MHGLHGLHGFHWLDGLHRLHSGDVLIRFFKRQSFRILQLGLSSHRLDLITLNSDKLHATFTLKTQNEVFGGAKQLRWLRPFAGTKARALILLLTRVAAAQRDLCVIAVILNEEPLAVSKIVGIRHKIVF